MAIATHEYQPTNASQARDRGLCEYPTAAETLSDAIAERRERNRAGWQKIIDDYLMYWLRDPSRVEDDGVDAPTASIIRLAIDIAEKYRDQGLERPDSVVPDPNGGIVFERRIGEISEVCHVWDDGSIEYLQFHGSRLVERFPVYLGN